MKSERKTTPKKRPPNVAGSGPTELLRPCLLMALVALCVARPLLPSEGVSWLGDGQPFNLLTLVLTVAYLVSAVVQGGLARRLTLVDGAVAALVLICATSAVVSITPGIDRYALGSPRLAINMLWEWVGLGLIFFLTRQLVRTPRETRALLAVMIALAVVLAEFGFYQVLVGLPEDRAAYAEDPDGLLRSLGQWFPPGSPERARFEDRLQSTEPLATFALTNSLAGFLASWLVVALGIAISSLGRRNAESRPAASNVPNPSWPSRTQSVALGACILVVAGCFVLTKSRSGYAAMLVGLALLPIASGASRRFFNRRFAVVAAGALLLVVGGAVAVKGLDSAVLTEATKSLGYRWQYWQATMSLIAHQPWLGCGPGNFQDYYTQFKLPQASEEIRDPHNFLLEVWATAGTFALIALGEVLGGLAWRTWRMPVSTSGETAAEPAGDTSTRSVKFMLAGGAVGLLLAFLMGPAVGLVFSEEALLAGLLGGGAVVALLWPWVMEGSLPPRLTALGVLVLAVNLLAAGGIAYPAVAGTFWILVALALNQTQPGPIAPTPDASRRRFAPLSAVGLTLTGMAAVACYITGYQPVLKCHAAMSKGNEAREHNLKPAVAGMHWLDAAQADPLSAEPWTAIAELDLATLKEKPTEADSRERFMRAAERLIELRPHSSAMWRQQGHWFMQLYEQRPSADTARPAVDCFLRAVELYPNFSALRGEYAMALSVNGKSAAARRQAEMALELDRQTPHADKKLPPKLRQRVEDLLAQPR